MQYCETIFLIFKVKINYKIQKRMHVILKEKKCVQRCYGHKI